MYETAEQEYGEITVTNASGSTSYSSWEDFHDDFVDELLGNIGSGSELTETEKTLIKSQIINISEPIVIDEELGISGEDIHWGLWNQTVQTWKKQDDTTITLGDDLDSGTTLLASEKVVWRDTQLSQDNSKAIIIKDELGNVCHVPLNTSKEAQKLVENMQKIVKALEKMKNITTFEKERGGFIYYDSERNGSFFIELLPAQAPGTHSIDLTYETNKNQPIIFTSGKRAILSSVRNEDIYATWHTHPPFPEGDADPSPSDKEMSYKEKRPGIVFQYNNGIWDSSQTKWIIWITDKDGTSFEYHIKK